MAVTKKRTTTKKTTRPQTNLEWMNSTYKTPAERRGQRLNESSRTSALPYKKNRDGSWTYRKITPEGNGNYSYGYSQDRKALENAPSVRAGFVDARTMKSKKSTKRTTTSSKGAAKSGRTIGGRTIKKK